jgi:pimeloyl-ACP methyl ester carboxylesterase
MPTMKERIVQITYNGITLKVAVNLRRDSDKWIVCLHGIQSNKELFHNLLQQEFSKKYSVLAIDNIGFGNSSKPEAFSYDVHDQANIIEQVIGNLKISKIHIIGHSLGGVIGTLLLKKLHEKVVSFINIEGNLTLINSGLTKEIVTYSFEEFSSNKYHQIKENVKKANEPSSKFRGKWLEKIPDYVFYKTSQSIITWVQSDKLFEQFSNTSIKRLFLYGDKNAALYDGNFLPKGIERVEIANAGHFMLIDNPKACYVAIERFLNEVK